MSIVRRKRTENFTIVPNHIWDDEYISFEAKSLLAYLLSRPDNWKVNSKHLQKVMGFGRDKTQKIVTSLVERGYIERRAIKGNDGLFAGQELVVFDEIDRDLPDNYGMPENQLDRDGVPENGEPENPCDGKSGTLIRTDKITRTDNINPISPLDILLDILDKETASAILAHRKSLRKPLTERAANLLVNELQKTPDPIAAANEMILRGWVSVKADWINKSDTKKSQSEIMIEAFARA